MFFRSLIVWASLLCVGLLSACADTQYYWQSVRGHLSVMQAARPIDQWLTDATTPEVLKRRLKMAQEIRLFAVTELHLPDNPSYQRYADLHRRFVVWNVVGAPEYSLKLKTWCFPVAGCVGYRGYFSQTDVQTQAQTLRDQGLETSVYGVPAYSTLGWMNWFGGDPLLNTFINYPEGELARMMFHELSHQVLYVPDDTMFNESFATAVERLGVAQWLSRQASISARQEYAEFEARRRQFHSLTRSTRDKLRQIYTQIDPVAPVSQAQVAMKIEAMQTFRSQYAILKKSWGDYSGYDTWVAQANNASFGAQAAYDELVPGFETLFAQQGGDWLGFYDAVRQLAKRPAAERIQRLKQ